MNNYKALRMWLNMTRRELADKLNVSPGLISMWENGTRRPSLNTILLLAKVANIRVEDILTFDVEIKRKEVTENDLPLHPAAPNNDQ